MAQFKMPPAHFGMPAIWYEGGSKDHAYAAYVLEVHHETVCLRVFGKDNDFIKDSPRHFSDPNSKDTDKHDEGLWDYTDMSRAFYEAKETKHKV